MADIKDKELSSNDEVKRSEKFQNDANLQTEIYEIITELLDSTTEKAFSEFGFERIEDETGEYATGKKYGYGAEEGKYQVRFAGKTKSNIEKQIIFGAKRVESQINMTLDNGIFSLEYHTPESGFFRGVDNEGKTLMVREKIKMSTKDMKKLKSELEKMFKKAAKKEVKYLTDTKLGVEDKIDASTTSIVENFNDMENLTIKSLIIDNENNDIVNEWYDEEYYEGPTKMPSFDVENDKDVKKLFIKLSVDGIEDINEHFPRWVLNSLKEYIEEDSNYLWGFNDYGIKKFSNFKELQSYLISDSDETLYTNPEDIIKHTKMHESKLNSNEYESIPDEEKHIEKVIQHNTKELENGTVKSLLLFDDEEGNKNEEWIDEVAEKYTDLNKDEINKLVVDTMMDKFGTKKLSELTPVEKKELFNTIDDLVISAEETVSEITTSGPVVAGGFRDGAQSGSGGYNTPKAFKNTGTLKRGKTESKSPKNSPEKAGEPYTIPVKDSVYESRYKKTAYAKSKAKRPKVDKNYNVIPETKGNNDGFWQTVKVDPDYHPQGMPFVKPGSKEEWERTSGVGRDHDKLERMGLKSESDADKRTRKLKRKFSSSFENDKKGINKRYIISEKTTKEYEQDRWSKLSQHKLYESIKEVDECSDILEEGMNPSFFVDNKKEIIKENVSNKTESIKQEEETILVENPKSNFGTCHKFYRKDFMNENKKYILDLNSFVFVPNPNSK